MLETTKLIKEMDKDLISRVFAEARANGGLIEITDHVKDLEGSLALDTRRQKRLIQELYTHQFQATAPTVRIVTARAMTLRHRQ